MIDPTASVSANHFRGNSFCFLRLLLTFPLVYIVRCPVCPFQKTQIQFVFICFSSSLTQIFPSLLFSVSLCAVRPRLWRERRRVMFGLSVWLLVSVSEAAGSSDSAGGAAGPSRVQPSPCDTLSVTDPLRLVTWHPPQLHHAALPFSQWPFHCHSGDRQSLSQSLTASLKSLQ